MKKMGEVTVIAVANGYNEYITLVFQYMILTIIQEEFLYHSGI